MPFFNKKSELEKNYKVGETLGSGNFAVVKKAQPRATKDELLKSGIPVDVAVKVIDKSKVEDIGDIEREIAIMNNMDHPNIIKLFEIFDEKRKINLVMELVTGGELFDAIVARGNYTEKVTRAAISKKPMGRQPQLLLQLNASSLTCRRDRGRFVRARRTPQRAWHNSAERYNTCTPRVSYIAISSPRTFFSIRRRTRRSRWPTSDCRV